ncbi:anti-sigma factor [Undibacterium sp. RuRC25W]|uniref:anti-sigma factor n=1 Tax=Undibacterium sp. RuRC25W TaxID=3413047 RepID=UPI003BF34224
MNIQSLMANTRLHHQLAAQYVLGTLRGGARRRFEGWLQTEANLRHVVRQWESHLLPMAEMTPTAVPSSQVWERIRQRVGLPETKPDRWRFWRELREDLAFWRGLGLASTAAVMILLSVLFSTLERQQTEQSGEQFVATLTDEKAQAVALITGDKQRAEIVVRMVSTQTIRADQSLELWSISKEGKVHSLGLIASAGQATLRMPDHMRTQEQAVLAISLEPKGGSGNPEKPSGPILFKGQWLTISS